MRQTTKAENASNAETDRDQAWRTRDGGAVEKREIACRAFEGAGSLSLISCEFALEEDRKDTTMAQLKKFGVLQTAKFSAILYFISTAVFMIPVGLILAARAPVGGGQESAFAAMFSGVFMFLAPIIYAVAGFIFVAIGCLFYNLIAKFVGGIELDIE
ncbi:MAG: hypothetical protein ACYTFQ_23345 [Planctomycetota bacterium]|jgi:hypothetical protein